MLLFGGPSSGNAIWPVQLRGSCALTPDPCNGGAGCARRRLGALLHAVVERVGDHVVAILVDEDAWKGPQSSHCARSRSAPARKTNILCPIKQNTSPRCQMLVARHRTRIGVCDPFCQRAAHTVHLSQVVRGVGCIGGWHPGKLQLSLQNPTCNRLLLFEIDAGY